MCAVSFTHSLFHYFFFFFFSVFGFYLFYSDFVSPFEIRFYSIYYVKMTTLYNIRFNFFGNTNAISLDVVTKHFSCALYFTFAFFFLSLLSVCLHKYMSFMYIATVIVAFEKKNKNKDVEICRLVYPFIVKEIQSTVSDNQIE